MSAYEPCPFCREACTPFATATVLGRHQATYVRCTSCGSVHVPDPYWLDEAYSEAIASTDIGLASRAVWTSQATSVVIRLFLRDAKRFCDYGGGNGLFVRLMRDAGYDFLWRDRYAKNEFAPGHESVDGERFDLVTAFEVLEHLRDPHEFLAEVQSLAPALLITTLPMPDHGPKPHEWWYYTLDTGQHISFPTRRGLLALASAHGLIVSSAGEMHVFANRRVPEAVLRIATARRVARHLAPFATRPSLLGADYERALR